MIKNYLKIAWRNLLKHKTFSLINILGLSVGITACTLIYLYVQHERTFDQYNQKFERIARVGINIYSPESDLKLATNSAPLATILKNELPEVENAVRIELSQEIVKLNGSFIREENFIKTESSIFSIFSFDFIEGTPGSALQNSNSVVLTESLAKKYFSGYGKNGNTAIGKTLTCNDKVLTISAVVKDRPTNSDMRIDAIMLEDFSKQTLWLDDFGIYTFVLFKQPLDVKKFERKIAYIGPKYVVPEFQAAPGAEKYKVDFGVDALKDVHFVQGKLADTNKSNRQYSQIFLLLAGFIMIIALLNYINLSTAKSSERAKEVGIRKVSGAHRRQLIRQFLFESVVLVSIATILAMGMVRLGLPYLNSILQTKLAVNWTYVILFAASIFLITILLAGTYPAFVLSAFKPISVLKGNWKHGKSGIALRKIITVTQFAIAAALIMGTVVIYSQLKYIREKNLGFNKDQLLTVFLPDDSTARQSVKAFQDALRQRPEVKDMTIGARMTDQGLGLSSTITYTEGKRRDMICNYFQVDENYIRVYQMKLVEGRNFSQSFGTDKTEGFIVNEAFVRTMGWKSALGQSIEGFERKGKIIGVVKDFYYKSLHNAVEPLVLIYNTNLVFFNSTTIKIQPQQLPLIKSLYESYFPSVPFDYTFVDEIFNKYYTQDRITMTLFNNFTLLAIFISCLGLYGLVALIALQRTKEIGVRKVLGASIMQLITLLSKGFLGLVCIALLIALPVAAFFMNKWLGSYAYHINLSWWMFLIPVIGVIVVAMAVISKEVIGSATANPVKSLRTE